MIKNYLVVTIVSALFLTMTAIRSLRRNLINVSTFIRIFLFAVFTISFVLVPELYEELSMLLNIQVASNLVIVLSLFYVVAWILRIEINQYKHQIQIKDLTNELGKMRMALRKHNG